MRIMKVREFLAQRHAERMESDKYYAAGYRRAELYNIFKGDLNQAIQVFDGMSRKGSHRNTFAMGIATYCRHLKWNVISRKGIIAI